MSTITTNSEPIDSTDQKSELEQVLKKAEAKLEVKIKDRSLWMDAWYRLKKDKIAIASVFIVVVYALIGFLSSIGVIAGDWGAEVGPSYSPPSSDFWLGTDIFGRSVMAKVIHGTQVAMSVGLISSLIAIPIGVSLGAIAGYYGGKVDELIVWFYTTFSSIPYIMLLMSLSIVFKTDGFKEFFENTLGLSSTNLGLVGIWVALGLTSWVALCRLIRGEVMKHKNREYVQAAESIGVGKLSRLFKHILPNVTHIVIIRTSLQFQIAIKAEVILSFLGIGVSGQPSWGTMIDDAKLELARGVWWQFAGATIAMFIVVLAFNILGDALRDALDPKLKGK